MPASADALPQASVGAVPSWERLRQRAQFDAVLSQPPVAKTQHFALHAVHPANSGAAPLFPGAGPWLGTLIPKRWAKRAVTRNALRRQIYAVSQHAPALWAGQAVVVRLRSGFAPKQFTSATSDALKRAARAELQRLFPGAPDERA